MEHTAPRAAAEPAVPMEMLRALGRAQDSAVFWLQCTAGP